VGHGEKEEDGAELGQDGLTALGRAGLGVSQAGAEVPGHNVMYRCKLPIC